MEQCPNYKIGRGLVYNRANGGILGGFVGPFYNSPGGYIPSFNKKELGSAEQRIQLAPIGAATTVHSQMPAPPFKPAAGNRSILNRPQQLQPVHGRTDWAAKYGGHR
ncbi:serine/threonine-protein kinase MAK-like [Xenopus laevis]|uniref:Serine/threonine-protein kinase MAK-like n=1 Tax=Xenopus laevis TaxID=8355 RepID=A0A8J1L2A9_XENLA|nr:serine/threonine-protein kinase MAK-like [Xenopus laevis]